MSRLKRRLVPLFAIAALISLPGCVAYPAYGGGGYYAEPSSVILVPGPVYRPHYRGGGYYGGGWGRGRWR